MNVLFSPESLDRLEAQLQYIRDQFAEEAAERLRKRVLSFVDRRLALFPRSGRKIDNELWEVWIPRTKLVLWYEIHEEQLVIVSVWHSAQDRARSSS